MKRIAWVGVLAVSVGCGGKQPAPTPAIITLSNMQLATTGGNLFNCGTPAYPAAVHALADMTVACDPGRTSDGMVATTPKSLGEIVGCGDGQGALVTVTCAGTGSGDTVDGTVTIALTPSCSSDQNPADVQTFDFQTLAPGETQATPAPLQSCAVFGNLCTPNDACEFNRFTVDVSVTNTLP